ncbi:MAG: Lrp/AsnC family transcriptional regulator [Pseudomonadota bacterium]
MDRIDQQILEQLRRDARISNVQLAERVNLSPTPCLRRVKKLETQGVIKGYRAELDTQALGYEVSAIAFIKLTRKSEGNAEAFEEAVGQLDAVTECCVVAGSYDYLLRIVARSLSDYELFLKKNLAGIEAIADIESTIILKQVECSALLS